MIKLSKPGLIVLFSLFTLSQLKAQDTTIIQTLTFDDITKRRGWYVFPEQTDNYRKILMYYTLKCDAATTQDQFACGEWDYTTYTQLYQHLNAGTPYYYLQNSNPDTIRLSSTPLIDDYHMYQTYTVIDNVMSETEYNIGSGIEENELVLNTSRKAGKAQYLFSSNELTNTGLSAGEIQKIKLDFTQLGGEIENMTIGLKHSNLSELSFDSYEDVVLPQYLINTSVPSMGWNEFVLTDAFDWDGVSNIVVEVCFTKLGSPGLDHKVSDEDIGANVGITVAENKYLDFELNEFVNVPSGVFDNIDSSITISFWCFGDTETMPFNSYAFEGRDENGRRVINSHLPWSNSRVYWDAGNSGTTSYDRIDLDAPFDAYAGKWNHWAFTKDVSTGEMKMFLNGQLFHSGTGFTRTMAGITKFKIAGTGNDDYVGVYNGKMDEFRIWNKALDQQTIQDWMHKSIDATHPYYANLQAAYHFDSDEVVDVIDYGPLGIDAKLFGLPGRKVYNGCHLNFNVQSTSRRPNISFVQGNYQSHLDSNLVVANIPRTPVSIVETLPYIDMNNTGITSQYVADWYAWESGYEYSYDPQGIATDSNFVDFDTELVNHYKQNVHQIQNYVTPYGIGLSLGPNGFRWVYDVTDYAPWLKDTVEFSAGNQQELIDVKFVMIGGTPSRPVLDAQTIWRGDWGHAAIADDNVLKAVDVDLLDNASHFTVKTRTTGHWFGGFNNCAEFCPKWHNLSVNGSMEFEWYNWKECADNPVIGQGGTWIYDRAGWCPGTFGDTYDHDITPFVTPGSTASLDYGMQAYPPNGGEGNYRITMQLIQYGDYNFNLDADIYDIIAPNNWEFYNRINPICRDPQVVVKNSGAETLNSIKLSYKVQGGATATFDWTGALLPQEKETVTLPISSQNFWMTSDPENIFEVWISSANGETDEYADNDYASATFDVPDYYPEPFYIWLKTNNAAFENDYTVTDDNGMVVWERDNLAANTTYKDTLDLPDGCYVFQFNDSGDDGLAFFANNDGTGYLRFKEVGGPTLISWDADYGKFITHHFVVGNPTNLFNEHFDADVIVYPNPSGGIYNIDISTAKNDEMHLAVYDLYGKEIFRQTLPLTGGFNKTSIDLKAASSGIYFLKITNESGYKIIKLIRES